MKQKKAEVNQHSDSQQFYHPDCSDDHSLNSDDFDYKRKHQWSPDQYIRYALFLKRNKDAFKTSLLRRRHMVFTKLSEFVATRTRSQVREHHRYFIRKFFHIWRIVQYIEKKYGKNSKLEEIAKAKHYRAPSAVKFKNKNQHTGARQITRKAHLEAIMNKQPDSEGNFNSDYSDDELSKPNRKDKSNYKVLWTPEENLRYAQFIKENMDLFQSTQVRKRIMVFSKMSKFIGTRERTQASSHHHKFQKQFGSLQNILQFIDNKYGRTQPIKEINKDKWTAVQNMMYAKFVRENLEQFQTNESRKESKIYARLTEHIKTRTTIQVRSHHHKMLKRHLNLQTVIEHIEDKFRKEYRERCHQLEEIQHQNEKLGKILEGYYKQSKIEEDPQIIIKQEEG